jgi:hypothetical protein
LFSKRINFLQFEVLEKESSMCCLATVFLVFGSRLTILYWWLTDPQRFNLAFKNLVLPGNYSFPVWIWSLVGAIFLPWTTLAYLIVIPGGVLGYDWIWLGVAFLIDIAGHGGSYRNRNRIPNYQRR